MRLPITALILAGGKSSRMGRDKALLTYEGQTLLSFVSRRLGALCEETLHCGATGETAAGARVVPDLHPGLGPVSGLEAGLEAASHDWCAALACDMPYFSGALLGALWERAQGAELDAVIPLGPTGAEPLHALYSKSALPAIREAISHGQNGLERIFRGARVLRVPWSELRGFDPEGECFRNWNRPEDLPAGVRESLSEARS